MCNRKNAIKIRYYNLGHKRCHYCCRQLNYKSGHKNSATVEHIIPKSKGGTLAQANTLVICSECNRKRGHKDFLSFVSGSRFPRLGWLKDRLKTAKEHSISIAEG